MKSTRSIIIEKTQIFISEKKAFLIIGLIVINMLILSFSFIFNLLDSQNVILNLDSSSEKYISIKNKMTMQIVSFAFNSILNIIYVLYIYFSITRKKVGYVFVLFWFFVWALFSLGTFMIYDINIYLKIVNLIVGIGSALMLLVLFFDLQKRKRELEFERRKKRNEL